MPDPLKQSLLIRSTLIALSQANATGNYSVLRELGAPAFQLANSPARLTDIFADLRRRKLDFAPVMFYDPKLVRQPVIDESGRLRLTGYIESRPQQIHFDMLFANAGGDWRLFGIAVEMQNVTARIAQPASPPPQQPSDARSAAAASKDKGGGEKRSASTPGWFRTTTTATPSAAK